jgi:hypothetical protein
MSRIITQSRCDGMAFVKLDCGLLNSTLWIDRECREVFITALLMAEPRELRIDHPQLAVRSIERTGFIVPAGWYGLVEAAGQGIVYRAMIDPEPGLAALERLCAPDPQSRSSDFEGRRLARINGGFIVLNFIKYREKDHTGAERAKRYRTRLKASRPSPVTSRVSHRDITHAEADAEAYSGSDAAAPAPSGQAGASEEHRRRFKTLSQELNQLGNGMRMPK